MDDFSFEWDEVKAQANSEKHNVTFEEAVTVFFDPFLLTFVDEEHSETEERYLSVGRSDRSRVLLVVHTERNDSVRLISSRKATPMERRIYEQQPR